MVKLFRAFSLLTALLVSSHTQADLQTGVDAIVRRDYDAALNAFKPLAEKGNVAAQVNLGNLYMKGLGVEQNYHLAQHWYLQAAEQGERMAQTKLGILYYYGLGIAKDPAQAARWFQKAAESGETSAQSILGSLYAAGEGMAKNPALAFYWYTMAEEQGDKEAAKGRKSLEEEITPGQRDEALRMMNETRKLRGEQEEKAFEATTAGLGSPPVPKADEAAVDLGDKTTAKAVKANKKPTAKTTADKPEKTASKSYLGTQHQTGKPQAAKPASTPTKKH
jgi:TPR repeat protein